tara:strand:- start:487 stop:1182 length:696 start_codon:yes stop_codon:yes gene_type:complete
MPEEKRRKGESNLVSVEGLGTRIREVRERRSMSQRALATRAQVPPSTIGRLETGDMNGSYTNTLASIAEVLECSCEFLVTGKGPQDRETIYEIKPAEENYEALVERMSPSTNILLKANEVVWTSHPGWGEDEDSIIGKHINDLVANTRLWITLSSHLTVGQRMDAPIRMKINGLWKDVYCKTVDSDTDEGVAEGETFTLLTLMDIPLRQRAMEMYQAERNYVQPAIASADF